MYTEFIALLSGRTLDDDEVQAKAAQLVAMIDEPEDWMVDLDFEPETIAQLSVEMTLFEFFLVGDKIDELHELISDEFAEPLKPFPHRDDQEKVLVRDYFHWLDGELEARDPPWALVEWDNDLDDNLHVVIVRRSDTERVLALANELGFRARATAHG